MAGNSALGLSARTVGLTSTVALVVVSLVIAAGSAG